MKNVIAALLLCAGCGWFASVKGQNKTLSSEKLSRIVSSNGGRDWIFFKGDLPDFNTRFFDTYRAEFELTVADEMRLLKTETDDETRLTHYYYQQYFKGYKVLFGQMNVHTRSNKPYKANGQLVRNNTQPATVGITPNSAEAIATTIFNNKAPWIAAPTQLVWVPANNTPADTDPANLVLCYQVELRSNTPTRGERYYINAATGRLVLNIPTIFSCNSTTAATVWYGNNTIYTKANGANNYEMTDDCNSTVVEVLKLKNGNVRQKFTSTNNTWTGSENAATALLVAKRTVQYYQSVHTRKSWDNADHRVVFMIDDPTCTDTLSCTLYNAYAGDTITFGNYGTAGTSDDYYTLDVFGHEFTHNVTSSAIPNSLAYVGESGALNESFSDIMGNAVEINYEGSSPTGDVWLVGEDRNNAGGSLWLRDMRNPNNNNPNTGQSGRQPKRYNGVYWRPVGCMPTPDNDRCGVHTNSGVQNYMFYLLTEGGTGNNEGIGFSVNGIGITKSRRIAYKTLTGGYLVSSSNHTAARDAWVHAAEDLYGLCSTEAIQTAEAWYAVGVRSNSTEYTTQVCGTIATTGGSVYRFGGGQLTAGGSCTTTITPSSNPATFSSGKAVDLKPGFTAPSGSVFYGVISGCNLTVF